jgi:hypothetical protein
VVTRIKADMRCAAVAAASVLAKVERDAIMVSRAAEHPWYGWELNKGYAAPDHIEGLRARGPSVLHRTSWSLPGVGGLADLAGMGGDELPLGLVGADVVDLRADGLDGDLAQDFDEEDFEDFEDGEDGEDEAGDGGDGGDDEVDA